MPFRTTTIQPLLDTAALRARVEHRHVLVSVSERIEVTDPLHALELLLREVPFAGAGRSQLGGEAMLWERPSESFALAGLGSVRVLEHSGPERFTSVARDWEELLDGAVVGGDNLSKGLGPMLMGGFAFEPEGPATPLWDGFPSAHLAVPRVLFSSVSGEHWVTLNLLVSPDGASDANLDFVRALTGSVTNAPRRRGMDRDPAEADLEISSLSTRGEWQESIRSAITEIRAGRLHKVVLARAVRASPPESIDVFALLRHLRAVSRESAVFGVWRGNRVFVGASPERLVRLTGREVEASSLAGTIERGATPLVDAANARRLRASAKDLTEHAAVRDDLYSALVMTCDDVRAPETPSLLTLPHVHHLHTSLRARLRDGGSLLDLVAQLHPTPAVGGSPREAALRFIRQHENLDRGWYAAPVGWISREGGEFAVALRSALVDENEAILFAGCGIVGDSDPDLEYEESNLKLRSMRSAIAASVSAARESEMISATERTA